MTVRAGVVSMFVMLAAVLSGCQTGGRVVDGRVLAGRVGVVTTVEADDARLSEPGIGGVTIRVSSPGASGSTLAEAVTLDDGSFSMHVGEDALFSRVELVATSPRVLTCRGTLYLPRDGKLVLVLVEPSGSGGVGEQAR